MGEKMPFRARNPEATRADILASARAEFAKAGLSGARVDKIAENSGANKRMIYHYFGSKEELFAAVVEEAYGDIRTREQTLGLDALEPAHADFAASWAAALEDLCINAARRARALVDAPVLAVGGAAFVRDRLGGRFLAECGFERVHLAPAADGLSAALGAVLHTRHALLEHCGVVNADHRTPIVTDTGVSTTCSALSRAW